jgi:hypothetical protein
MAGPTGHENAGETVGGYSYTGNCGPGAVVEHNALLTKSLDKAESMNDDIVQGVDEDTSLSWPWIRPASTADHGIGKPGDGVPIQVQRQARRTNSDAGSASNCADYITDKLAVFRDR